MSLKCPERFSTSNDNKEFIVLGDKVLKRWLSSPEAAMYLSISEGVLRNLARDGSVPYYKLGTRNRYCINELDALILSEPRGLRSGNKV